MSSPSFSVGQLLGHYRILEQIGAGSMGIVYRAHDERLDRDVALKVLPPGALADQAARKRFRQEARALAQLNHPNIATVHDFDTLDAIDFLVMEYIDGVTLSVKIAKGALSEKEVLALGGQITKSLEAAHEHGIVHRDIKPGNIMVTRQEQVKVLDFGLARILRPTGDAEITKTQTVSPEIVGTLPYMAPELLHGHPADPRSDVWAFGVLLYEMVSGGLPFRGRTGLEMTAAILSASPPTLSSRVPAALRSVIRRCLEKEAAQRYHSAIEVRAALEAIQSGAALPPLGRTAKAIDSLAVLPFVNVSGDPETEYLSDGLAESLINSLSQLPKLRVVPRSTAFRYKGGLVNPEGVGRDLNVRAVLTGRVLQRGEELIVSVELVDVSKAAQIWGERYNRKFSDLFTVQDGIAMEISQKLRLRLTREEKKRLTRRVTENREAYELLLMAQHHTNKWTPEGLRKGLEYCTKAVNLDPACASAYSTMAMSFSMLGVFGLLPPSEAFSRAKAAALRALEIDKGLADAHLALATAKGLLWDFPDAEREFKRALELNPDCTLAHQYYARYLFSAGRSAEGIAELDRALELEPLSLPVNYQAGVIFLYTGHYDEAVDHLQKSLELDPDFIIARGLLGYCYSWTGAYEEAVRECDIAASLAPGHTFIQGLRTWVYAKTGKTEEARKLLTGLKECWRPDGMSSYVIAATNVWLGEIDAAFDWLNRAFEEHSFGLTLLKVNPTFANLHSDPRFQELVRRIGLPP